MVNYPHGKNGVSTSPGSTSKGVSFGGRGMSFETMIEFANAHYLTAGIAVIHKKPTPVQVVKVDYPKREAAKITEAYFKKPSTTDFNGVYQGVYIDFEAKETSNTTRFPLQNIHEHQIEHILSVADHGGFSFLLMKFSKLNEIYALLPNEITEFWLEYKQGARKSIKRDEIAARGIPIAGNTYPTVDYLKALDGEIKKMIKA